MSFTTDLLSEDDTFNALRRDSFNAVLERIGINRSRYAGIGLETAKRQLTREIAIGDAQPHSSWVDIAGGWAFDDFKEECIKRHNEYIRQQEGRLGLHDSGR
jgi:hypothetical protein